MIAARALEAAALSKKADDGPHRAILGPVAKRIEKKLTRPVSEIPEAPSRANRKVRPGSSTDCSVGMEAEGIAARGN
jgi:hypothetical protein